MRRGAFLAVALLLGMTIMPMFSMSARADSWGEYTSTGDWDGGTKANTTTETDRYNISTGDLEIDFPYADKDANLQMYLRMESEAGGVTPDETANSNDGTVDGATADGSGKFGGAYIFDGANDFINCQSDATLDDLSSMTLSAWIYWEGVGASDVEMVVNKFDAVGWMLYAYDVNDLLRFAVTFTGVNGAWATPTDSLTKNAWSMVTITYDRAGGIAENPVMYVNGASEAVTEVTTPTGAIDSDAAVNVFVGLYSGGVSYPFDGKIDETKIYERELSGPEITELYNSGNRYKDEGNWTSPLITQPTGDVLNNITIDLNNSWAGNCIDQIEILNSTDAVISTDTTDLTTNGTIVRNWSTFDNGFNGTYDNGSFKIKIFLKGPGTDTPILQRLNYSTVNYSVMAYIKWDGGTFADVNDAMLTRAITTYNITLAEQTLFWPGDTVYFNGTITLSQAVADVVVNVTVNLDGGTFLAELLNTTHTFAQNIAVNLTEIASGLLSWTSTTQALYYVNLYVYKTGEVNADNDTEYFRVTDQIAGADINVRTYSDITTTTITTRFIIGNTIYFNGTVNLSESADDVSVTLTLANLTGGMGELMNTTFDFTGGITYNLTDINSGIIFWNGNQAGNVFVTLAVYNDSVVVNASVTEDFLIIPATPTPIPMSGTAPIYSYDVTPFVEAAWGAKDPFILGFLFIVLMILIYKVYQKRKHLSGRRWRSSNSGSRWRAPASSKRGR